MAGVTQADVDVAMFYDAFTIVPVMGLEALGFCKPGEAEHLLESGETLPTGKLPINPSGGFISFGEATTAQGLFQICEVGWQLRGAAGDRQVANAKVGLAQTLGLGGNGSASILKI